LQFDSEERRPVADNAVQVSFKKPDGTIYVVGGADVDSFDNNLVALQGGQRDLADALLDDMIKCLTPMASTGPAGGGNYYTAPAVGASPAAPAGGQRIATQPVAVKIPWNDKAQADPFLTPLKAARLAQWDATNKQWILMPGADLAPFARWLPPGA